MERRKNNGTRNECEANVASVANVDWAGTKRDRCIESASISQRPFDNKHVAVYGYDDKFKD